MARILIADDSAASRMALRSLLRGNGWEVCGEAGDGLSAVEKAAILKPDLVILDYRMPNLDGLQAGQAIHTADPTLPLLLFTLDEIVPLLQELAHAAGFRGALAKSEGIFAISEAVEALLQGKTFFLGASESRSRATLPNDSTDTTEEARKNLKATEEPSAQIWPLAVVRSPSNLFLTSLLFAMAEEGARIFPRDTTLAGEHSEARAVRIDSQLPWRLSTGRTSRD